MKTSSLLLIGLAGFLGYEFLFGQNSKQNPLSDLLGGGINIGLPSTGSGGTDSGLSGIVGALTGAISNLTSPLSSGLLSGSLNTGGAGSSQTASLWDAINNLTKMIPNSITAAGQAAAMTGAGVGAAAQGGSSLLSSILPAAEGAGIFAGTILGVKALSPLIPGLSNALKTPVSDIAGAAGRTMANLATKTGGFASGAIDTLFGPVSQAGIIPVAGGVIAAGAAGYFAGTALMNDTPLGKITTGLSAKAGASSTGQFILQKTGIVAAPAQVNQTKVNSAFASLGLTNAQVQAQLKAGVSPGQIVTRAKQTNLQTQISRVNSGLNKSYSNFGF